MYVLGLVKSIRIIEDRGNGLSIRDEELLVLEH